MSKVVFKSVCQIFQNLVSILYTRISPSPLISQHSLTHAMSQELTRIQEGQRKMHDSVSKTKTFSYDGLFSQYKRLEPKPQLQLKRRLM
jgi:hypothetical protein